MKLLIILFFIGVATAEQYTTEHDDFEVEKLVKDPVRMKAFLNCFVDKGTCDEVSGHFKQDLPEAIRDACVKCTLAQKHILRIYLEELKKHPQDYQQLQDKYDKDKKLFARLEAAIANA